jgi:hypothetical protein
MVETIIPFLSFGNRQDILDILARNATQKPLPTQSVPTDAETRKLAGTSPQAILEALIN